jgi:hypothetical protein
VFWLKKIMEMDNDKLNTNKIGITSSTVSDRYYGLGLKMP